MSDGLAIKIGLTVVLVAFVALDFWLTVIKHQ